MTQYAEADWYAKAEARRLVRNEVREAFWNAIGADPHTSTNTVERAPEGQLVPVVRLMQITRDALGDADMTSFLPQVAMALRQTGIGKGAAMAGVGQNIEDLTKFGTYALEHFFTHPYKFEGPRDGSVSIE